MNDADRRDAHLQAALRHAPDRELAAPDAVSARILAQARAAVPARAVAPQPGWVERWFGWMSRPVAAGAFGTLLIAAFVGLMWRGGPPPEALPGADRETPAAAPAPAPAPAPAAAVAPVPAAAPAPVPAPAPTPAPATQAAPVVRDSMPPPPARTKAAEVPAPAAPAARPQPAAAPPPPPEAVHESAAVPTPAADAGANRMAAPAAVAPAAAPAPAPAAAPAQAPPRAALRQRSDAAAFDPLVPALARLAPSPGNPWHTRLQRLQQRLATPWGPGGAPPTEGGDAVPDAQGRYLGRLWVTGSVILWQDPDGNLWRATLRDE